MDWPSTPPWMAVVLAASSACKPAKELIGLVDVFAVEVVGSVKVLAPVIPVVPLVDWPGPYKISSSCFAPGLLSGC